MPLISCRQTSRAAFTLGELFAVITILCVLMTLLMPAVQITRNAAKSLKCISNLRQVGLFMLQFAIDNRGRMVGNAQGPTGTSSWSDILNIEQLADQQVKMPRIGDTTRNSLLCPAFKCPPNEARRSYRYNFFAAGGYCDEVARTSDYGTVITPASRQNPAYVSWPFYCLGTQRVRFADPSSKIMVQESYGFSDYCIDTTTIDFRHSGKVASNLLFLDGHAAALRKQPAQLTQLRYDFQ